MHDPTGPDHDARQNTTWPEPVPRQARVERRRRRRLRRFGTLAGAAVLVVALAAAIPSFATSGSSSSSSSSSAAPSGTTPDSSATPVRTDTNAMLDTSRIAQLVDPAVVDITTTLAYDGGQAAGTGMIISSSGDILTNNHVIEGASEISVALNGRSRTYTAELVGTDPADDVALVKIGGVSNLPTVKLGSSARLSVGDRVIAIGNALNLPGPPRVTEGSVNATGRAITVSDDHGGAERLTGLIQTDAELSPGNSGGPLLDGSGEVIGINTAAEVDHLDRRDTSSTTGYAIPIEKARTIVGQIQSGDEGDGVQVGATAFLGVQARDADTRSSSSDKGALVVGVVGDGPAADAGLNEGDVVIGVGGQTIATAEELVQAVHSHDPGDKVTITWVDSSGLERHATVHLEEGPAA